jgi:hypothetical protein
MSFDWTLHPNEHPTTWRQLLSYHLPVTPNYSPYGQSTTPYSGAELPNTYLRQSDPDDRLISRILDALRQYLDAESLLDVMLSNVGLEDLVVHSYTPINVEADANNLFMNIMHVVNALLQLLPLPVRHCATYQIPTKMYSQHGDLDVFLTRINAGAHPTRVAALSLEWKKPTVLGAFSGSLREQHEYAAEQHEGAKAMLFKVCFVLSLMSLASMSVFQVVATRGHQPTPRAVWHVLDWRYVYCL